MRAFYFPALPPQRLLLTTIFAVLRIDTHLLGLVSNAVPHRIPPSLTAHSSTPPRSTRHASVICGCATIPQNHTVSLDTLSANYVDG